MAPEGADRPSRAPGEDCPCCQLGGWIRDLPPQGQAVELAPPSAAVHDLPAALVTEFMAAQHDPVVRREATGPPTGPRPHAAPVGSVRLQT